MANTELPLKEVKIEELFFSSEKSVYEIPIYQRNYAWEKDEITTLVQDVYDAYRKDEKTPYYIGTLVTFNKGDRVFEIIDGQQRLTTIRLLLEVLELSPTNKLTYRARKKSDDTLKTLNSNPQFDIEEKDSGIVNGFWNAKSAIDDTIRDRDDWNGFKDYFIKNVRIIHYQVPKDINLNHYFEIMNSRGEQLEKHEIVKAKLLEKLSGDSDASSVFNIIWNCCSEMSVYVQQKLKDNTLISPEDVFGINHDEFLPESFSHLLSIYKKHVQETELDRQQITIKIKEILDSQEDKARYQIKEDQEGNDTFLPIIDFPNFLLIVLKITRMGDCEFYPSKFNLDDKELLHEFDDANMNAETVKSFAFNLLKAKFYLDNYIVHHSKEEDTIYSNPWKLQVWHKDEETNKSRSRNLAENTTQDAVQDRLTHLLSMFEVSFTARQRKNYLFYCLLYLLNEGYKDIHAYARFVEELADRYFNLVYLDRSQLNSINTPIPGSFDDAILEGNSLWKSPFKDKDKSTFAQIYGDGEEATKGVPLFVFNYLDYKIWKLYDEIIRSKKYKEESEERKEFFERLGCKDFGLDVFKQFYFSRTRRSLEHYYPQAKATGGGALNEKQINCFGNFAMIGSEANSSGSNWDPKTKINYYLDSKINRISVASLKFMIMMQICKDKQKWEFEEIRNHQEKMVSILLDNQDTQATGQAIGYIY